MSWFRGVVIAAFVTLAACSSISTVRVQPDNVFVAKGLRPIAVVHAKVTSFELLFFEIPGHISLDYVVNRMLIHAAKQLGADKVVNIQVDITPDDGIWVLRRIIGWRSAQASGVAVVVEDADDDANDHLGSPPQPATPPVVPAPSASK